MKLALAMIVKGTNEEALLLKRCLENLSPFVDGIFITRTHKKGEKPNHAVGNVATLYNAKLSDFEWVDDFAAARNFNFAQVPKEYDWIMWTDADDMWRGLEKLRATLEDNKLSDGFGLWYLYDWDESRKPVVVHRKTMIVKNDGAVTWAGALHEDMKPLRSLDVKLIEGIERLHLSTAERGAENAKRNVEIAKKDVVQNPDDPRSFFNLGNAQYGVGDFAGATASFEAFLVTSRSDDEKYIIYSRLADCYRALGERELAVRQLQIAIGLFPTLPDAYLQLAAAYYQFSDLEKAEHYLLQGLVKRPVVNKMIVFNPRDYDYNPMMLLARIYFQKNRPDLMLPILRGCLKIYPDDEKLKAMVKDGEKEYKAMEKALLKVQKISKITDKKKMWTELEKLTPEMQSHPAVAVLRNNNFIKETSSGKDLVIYCGMTAFQWHGELFKTRGFGGSEEAVVNLAQEWAKMGWSVTVYNNCGHKAVVSEGVTYKPFWLWNYRDKQDAVILWRWAKPLDAEINSPKVFLDLHDVVPDGEFTERRLARVTKVMVKSAFQRSLLPSVPDHKIAIIPNGFNPFTPKKPVKKDPFLIINTSSPDRSLDVLPELFEAVKAQVPQARLQWAYGWDNFKQFYANDPKKLAWMDERIKKMKEVGIESVGRLTQQAVGELYWKASVLAYPTEFAEIDCISVRKAQAARCTPVTTDFAALAESNVYGVKIPSKKTKDSWSKPYQFHFGLEDAFAQATWVGYVVELLNKTAESDWVGVDAWTQEFGWPAIAKRWEDLLL